MHSFALGSQVTCSMNAEKSVFRVVCSLSATSNSLIHSHGSYTRTLEGFGRTASCEQDTTHRIWSGQPSGIDIPPWTCCRPLSVMWAWIELAPLSSLSLPLSSPYMTFAPWSLPRNVTVVVELYYTLFGVSTKCRSMARCGGRAIWRHIQTNRLSKFVHNTLLLSRGLW